MTIARKDIVMDGEEGIYLCTSRCVRRAFLCGEDAYSRKNFDHRKPWVRDRLVHLVNAMAVEVGGFSIMSNHHHCILRTRPDLVDQWADAEVARRWLLLCPKRKDTDGIALAPSRREIVTECKDPMRLGTIRGRMSSVSWFMRFLNEFIAKRANREDGVTGRFFEGRFGCKAILDEASLVACLAYVDLNPIRAKFAETPEDSDFTSIFERIISRQARQKLRNLKAAESAQGKVGRIRSAKQRKEIAKQQRLKGNDRWLCAMDKRQCRGGPRKGMLPISLDEYLELVDYTGRQIKAGKRGAIPVHLAPVLERLNLDVDRWVETVLSFGKIFWRLVGRAEAMMEAARRAGRHWFKGVRAAQRAFAGDTS